MHKVLGLLLLVVAAGRGQYQCTGFTCDDGSCISSRWVCDGSNDCNSGIDESDCTSCPPHFYQCTGSFIQCIVEHWVCDGYTDCIEWGDDETNCQGTAPTECTSNQYQCDNGFCINEVFHCDGVFDCYNDEYDCESCKEGFHCQENMCILDSRVCDEFEQCAGGEDEVTYCECLETDFVCSNGHCIPEDLHCNGVTDCYGGSDEVDCRFNDLHLTHLWQKGASTTRFAPPYPPSLADRSRRSSLPCC